MRWAPELALRCMRPTTRELGFIGECIAARHLQQRGARIVARRLRTRAAEVDLVVRIQRSYACVEVKTGRATCIERDPASGPGSRLGHEQLARLRAAARLIGREVGAEVRVDLVEVCLDRAGRLDSVRVHRALREPLRRTDNSRLL